MSWDVMILNSAGTPKSFADVPNDWEPLALGDAGAVRERISATLPGIDWSDPAWGLLDAGEYSFEFNFQSSGVVGAFTIHVHGGGDPLPAIANLCLSNQWLAFDYSTGEMVDASNPSRESWEKWKNYRDRVIADGGRPTRTSS